jgi:multiple antibiotic resistance protein
MSDYVQAAVTILALINPAICAVIFSSTEHGRDSRNQVGDATKAAAAILIILAVAAVAGASVLSAFGISLDAFQVAGSVVLVWMGFSMLTGSGHSGSPEGASGGAEAPSLLPRRSRSVSRGFCCWRRSGWAERVDRATSSPPVLWV